MLNVSTQRNIEYTANFKKHTLIL